MSSKQFNQSFINSNNNDASRQDVMLDFESLESLVENLNLIDLYEPKMTIKQSSVIGFAPVITQSIIDCIIQKGASLLYQNYIQSKISHHSILRTFQFQEIPQKMFFLDHDEKKTHFEIDSEPQLIETEKWRRLVIETEKKEVKLFTENFDNTHDQKYITKSSFKSTFNIQHSQGFKKSYQKQHQFPEFNPQQVDMRIPVEFDHETETLRVLKERENQMKIEKFEQEQQREKEMKDQQSRLKNSLNDVDLNKKLITYDFDGKILLQNTINIEKLPNTIQQMNHQIFNDQNQIQKSQNKKKESKQQQQQYQSQTNIKEKEEKKQKKSYMSQQSFNINSNNQVVSNMKLENIIEQFDLKEGVTLISNGLVKEGPKKLQISEQSNLIQLFTKSDQKVKLTKHQYNQLILEGNLTRGDQNSQKHHNQYQNQNKSELSIKTNDEQLQFLNEFKVNNFSYKILNQNQTLRNVSKGSIKIENQKQLLQLRTDNSDDYELKTQREKQNRFKTTHLKTDYEKSSILEEFNRTLLTNNHEIQSQRELFSLPKIFQSTKPKTEQYRKSLGILSKLPRNRMSNVANSARSFQYLPPPGYGKVMGHGINSGVKLNPFQEDKIETILDKLNNNSQI